MADLPLDESIEVTIRDSTDQTRELTVNADGSINTTDVGTLGTGTIVALNGTVIVPVVGKSTVTFNITGTWVATLTFQGSVDNGVTYTTIIANLTAQAVTTSTSANDRAIVACAGYTHIRLIATAFTSGTATITWSTGAGQQLSQVWNTNAASLATRATQGPAGTVAWLIEDRASTLSSYAATVVGLVTAATATDIFTITGSGTKTIKITRVEISGTATAATSVNIELIKRSTADSGGTSSAVVVVPLDSNNAAGTATVLSYTANPTLGTNLRSVRAARYSFSAAGGLSQPLTWNFGGLPAQPPTLRGTSQQLVVNFNSTTVSGASIGIAIEWTEE